MRALFSAVSGIKSHQVRMDVIANNIANVNTTGFKGSHVAFTDILSQTLSAAASGASMNQVGLGVGVAATCLDLGESSLQYTGQSLDLAIEGSGMFVLRDAHGKPVYTRAGSFDFNRDGYLINAFTGDRVQGWMGEDMDAAAVARMGDIRIQRGSTLLGDASTYADLSGNLDAGAAVGTETETRFIVYDSLGNPQSVFLQFQKAAPNTWDWQYWDPDTGAFAAGGQLVFDTEGVLQTGGTSSITLPGGEGAADVSLALDFGTVTQSYAGTGGSEVIVHDWDGNPMGVLESVEVDNGTLIGVYSTGLRIPMATVATADFPNPAGLEKVGGSSFAQSVASGDARIGKPSTGGRGRVIAGSLEMSNVDLSGEFTDMILTQRGFQANTRVVSTADEMLLDLINLRR